MMVMVMTTLSLKTRTLTKSKFPDLNSAVTGVPAGRSNISVEFEFNTKKRELLYVPFEVI